MTTTSPDVLRQRQQPRARSTNRVGRWMQDGGVSKLLFTLPMLLVFGVFSWGPIVRSLVMSVQQTNFVGPAQWVGLENFRTVLDDRYFGKIVMNTLQFAFLALIFGYPMPLVTAVLMSEVRRRKGLYSALVYLPVIIPPVVAVLLWKAFYDPTEAGLFNNILARLPFSHLGPYPWLQDKHFAMPSLVAEATWAAAGGTVIIYLAALHSISSDLYEAAGLDGAGVWRKVWHVTMPQLRGVLLVTLILQIIGTAQVFLEPFLFTNGGPANATRTILYRIFDYGFGGGGQDFGAATALSVMLAVFLCLLSAGYFRVTRSWSQS
ncbi:MAG: sugar ABC transporter permease [Mycobacteriales bacterium]